MKVKCPWCGKEQEYEEECIGEVGGPNEYWPVHGMSCCKCYKNMYYDEGDKEVRQCQ